MDKAGVAAASAAAGDQLYAVLISVLNDTLLLPNLAIAEVVPPDALKVPAFSDPGAEADWYAGSLTWSGIDVPVVRFERLNGGGLESPGRRTRVVILNPVARSGAASGSRRFGLICEGYPHLLTLNRAAIRATGLRPGDDAELVLNRARVASQETLIPDLAAIERRIVRLLAPAG